MPNLPLKLFVQVKDQVCIYYQGHSTEYIVQLRMLRKDLQDHFNLNITLGCRSEYMEYLDSPSIALTNLSEFKYQFGFVHEIVYNTQTQENPVYNLIEQIPIKKRPILGPITQNGIICYESNFPTEPLTKQQIEQLKQVVQKKGLKVIFIGNEMSVKERRELARKSGFVGGVECDMLYEAIDVGIPTSIFANSKIYETLCSPNV